MDHNSNSRTTTLPSWTTTATSHSTPAPLQPRSACIEPPLRNIPQNYYGNNNLNHHRYHSASSSTSSNSNSAVSFASGASSGVLTTASNESSFFTGSAKPPPANSSASMEEKIRNILYEPIRRLLSREAEGLIITPGAVSLIERKLACLLHVLLRNAPTKIADVRERIRKLMPQIDKLVIKDADEKKKKQLILPHDRLHELICDELRFLPNKIDPNVSLYLIAVMEYMARDLLVFVGRFVRDKHIRRCEITENDIQIIIRSDASFHKLFEPDAAGAESDGPETSLQWIAGGDDVINYSTPSPATNPSTPLDVVSATHNNTRHNNSFSIMMSYYASLPQQELNFAQIANELWAKQKEHCELLNIIRLVFRNALRNELVRTSRAAAGGNNNGADFDEASVTDADLSDADRREFELVFANIDDVFDVAEQFLNQVEDAKDMSPDPAQLAEEMRVGLNHSASTALLSASSGSDSIGTGSHPASANNTGGMNNIFFPDTSPHYGGNASRHSHRYQKSSQRIAQHQQHRNSTSNAAASAGPGAGASSQRHHLSASSHSLATAAAAAGGPPASHYNSPLADFGDAVSDTGSLLSSSSNSTPLHHRRASISTTSTSTTVTTTGENTNPVANKLSPLYNSSNTQQRTGTNNNTLLPDPGRHHQQQAESPRRGTTNNSLLGPSHNNNISNFNFDYADEDYAAAMRGGGGDGAASSAALVTGADGTLLLSASDKIQFGFCFQDFVEGQEFDEYFTYAERVMTAEHRDALRRLLQRSEIERWLHASTSWMRDCFLHVLPKLLLYPCYYMAEFAEYIRRLRLATPVREEKELLQEAESNVRPIAQRIDSVCRKAGSSCAIGFRFSKVHDENSNAVSARLQHLKKTTENYPDSALHQFAYTLECDAYKIKHNQAPSEAPRHLVLFENALLLLRPVAKPTNPLGMVASMLKGTNPSSTPLYEYSMKYDGSASSRGGVGAAGGTKDRLLTANLELDDCTASLRNHAAVSNDSGYANALIGATSGLSLSGVSDVVDACSLMPYSTASLNPSATPTTNATMIIFDNKQKNSPYRFQFKDPEDKPKFFAAFCWNQWRSLLVRTLDAAVRDEEFNSTKLMPGRSYRFTQQNDEEAIVFDDETCERVKAATLEKLVERATSTYNMDLSFIKVFLAVYRSFCTAQELMDLLIERFFVPSPREDELLRNVADQQQRIAILSKPHQQTSNNDPSIEKEEQLFQRKVARPIRMRVLSFLKHWVESYLVDFEGNSNEELMSKLSTIIDSHELIQGRQMERCVEAIRGRISTAGSSDGGGFGNDADMLCMPSPLLLADPPVKTSPHSNSVSAVSSPSTPSAAGSGGGDAVSSSRTTTTTTVLCVTDTNGGTTTTTNHHQTHHHHMLPDPGGEYRLSASSPHHQWHCTRDSSKYHLLSLHPDEIARQLTLLSHDLYCSISVLEFLRYVGWSGGRAREEKNISCPNVHRVVERLNTLSYWLARNIVETQNLTERVAVVSRIIRIMHVLVHFHNYADAYAFIAALGNAAVHRLVCTREKLDTTDKKRLDDARKLSEGHQKHYKDELDKLSSNEPCVPFIGYFFTPINQLGEWEILMSSSTTPSTTTPTTADTVDDAAATPTAPNDTQQQPPPPAPLVLINFGKHRRVYDLVEQALRFQAASYSQSKWKMAVEPSIRYFLESINPYSDLPPCSDSSKRTIDNTVDQYLYEKSNEIERKDQPALVAEPKFDKSWLKPPVGNEGVRPRHIQARMNSSSALAATAAGIAPSPSVFSMASSAGSDAHLSFYAGAGGQPLSGGGRSSTTASYARRHNAGASSPTCTTPTTTTTSSSPRSPASPAAAGGRAGSGSVGPSSQRRHLSSFAGSTNSAARERCNSQGSSSIVGGGAASSIGMTGSVIGADGGNVLFGNENNFIDALEDAAERQSIISSSPTLKNVTDDDLDSNGGGSTHNNQHMGGGLYRGGSGSRRPPKLPDRHSYLGPASHPPPVLAPKPEEFSALMPKRNKNPRRFVAVRQNQQQPTPPTPPPPPSAAVLP